MELAGQAVITQDHKWGPRLALGITYKTSLARTWLHTMSENDSIWAYRIAGAIEEEVRWLRDEPLEEEDDE